MSDNFEFEKNTMTRADEKYAALQQRLPDLPMDQAINEIESFLFQYSEFAMAYNDLAVLHYRAGNKEKCETCYLKAIHYDPKESIFKKNLADFLYIEKQDAQGAMEIYVQVLKDYPKDIEVLLMIARICSDIGQPDDSLVFLNRVLDINPWHQEALAQKELLQKKEAPPFEDEAVVISDTQTYKVSAIVSTYNASFFIKDRIEDLLNQTIQHRVEIIIVDSGSEQNEGEIVKPYLNHHPNIVYLRTEERESVYGAWNRAIQIAKGEYITNSNTDDRLARDAFEKMAAVLDSHPDIGLVYADVYITEEPNKTFDAHVSKGAFQWPDWNRNLLFTKGCFMGPQPMWRKSIHEEYGLFNDSFVNSGDFEFWARISQTHNFYHLPAFLGVYLRHDQSIEHQNQNKKMQEDMQILNTYLSHAKNAKLTRFVPLEHLSRIAQNKNVTAEEIGPIIEKLEKISCLKTIATKMEPGWTDEMEEKLKLAFQRNDSNSVYNLLKHKLLFGDGPVINILPFIDLASFLILKNSSWWNKTQQSEGSDPMGDLQNELDKAKSLYHKDDLSGAVEILFKCIAIFTNASAQYLLLAELFMDANNHQNALEVLQQIQTNEDSLRKDELIAVCLIELKQYDDFKIAYDQLKDKYPESRMLPFLMGAYFEYTEQFSLAEENYQTSIQVNPNYGKAYTRLGQLNSSHENSSEKYGLLEKGFLKSPMDSECITCYHNFAVTHNNIEQATPHFEIMNQKYPTNKRINHLLIDLYLKQQNFNAAIDLIESALAYFNVDTNMISAAVDIRSKVGVKKINRSKKDRPTISLCMIVKNEADHLAHTLFSARKIVDEIIIVDTGSTDNTIAIGTVFGAHIFDYKWDNDFSCARNFSIEKSSGDWILILDGDEIISLKDRDAMLGLIQNTGSDPVAFSFLTRNYTSQVNTIGWVANDGRYQKEEKGLGWLPSQKVRLFPRGSEVKFTYPIHELVEPSLVQLKIPIIPSLVPIHHYGKLNLERGGKKAIQYFELGVKKISELADDPMAIRELAIQASHLNRYQDAIDLWNIFIPQIPNMPDAYVNLGTAHFNLGEYSKALELASKAVALDPKLKEAHLNQGLCLLYLNQADVAVPILENLNAQHPDYLPAQFMLTAAYCCNENPKNAHTFFKHLKAMPIGEKLSISIYTIALGLFNAGLYKYSHAILKCAEACEIQDKDTLSLVRDCEKMINI